ncbi:MAG: hypothetical protein ACLRQR_13505 [Merdimonas faecis]|uniref:hypothetical protein n=1 Tax=Merdimonas faecis TaxID=1653435 RepID=UPI003990B41C
MTAIKSCPFLYARFYTKASHSNNGSHVNLPRKGVYMNQTMQGICPARYRLPGPAGRKSM